MGYALNPSHQRPADEARRFPVELINATPAAAPAPPRKEVGRAQNIGKDVMMPAVATVSPIMAIKGLLPNDAQSRKPGTETRTGMTTCQRRSRRRSELRPAQIIPTSAAQYGIVVRRPMDSGSDTPEVLMIVG